MPDWTFRWKRRDLRGRRTGRIVREMRSASEAEALVRTLEAISLPPEAQWSGSLLAGGVASRWLARSGLTGALHQDAPGECGDEDDAQQDDRNDARALAQIMRTGWFRQIHVKSRQCRLWRSLLVARRTVLGEMRSIENVVRAILREAGLKLGTPGRKAFASRVCELAQHEPLVMQRGEPLLGVLAGECQDFRVRAAIVEPKEVLDGTTQGSPYS